MEMKSCDMGSVFVPIISGPLHRYNLKIDLNLQNAVEANSFIVSPEINFNLVLLAHPPELPPAFNLPLLI